MQHSDGTWSHKRGTLPVSNCAAEGSGYNTTKLTNSNIVDNIQNANYDLGYRFFYITKDAVVDYPHGDRFHGGDTPTLFADKAGDTITTATYIDYYTDPLTINAKFDYFGDIDWYYFKAPATGSFYISTSYSGPAIDIDAYIYDACGNQIASDTRYGNVNVGFFINDEQYYFIKIINYTNTRDDYTITISY